MKKKICSLTIFLLMLACSLSALAQDAHEALGPKDGPKKGGKHPLVQLTATLKSSLRPELKGVHPRVYFTADELKQLQERAKTSHKDLWGRALGDIRALKVAPPPPPAETRRAQNEVGLGIAEAAFAYRIEGDRKYLEAAKRYMDAAVSYEIWGYAYNKPNVDLAAGHLLYGMGIGYDLLYNDLTPAERTKYRDKIAKHAKLLADHYKLKPGRSFSYSQNHVFIPIAGLAVASYALYDEVPEASHWAAVSRAIYDRVLATYSPDGYYYEGFEYWVFSMPWMIHYLDAHKHATGEDLYDHPGLKQAHLYLAHVMAPGAQTIFDFGDVFEGPRTRAKQGDEYERSHPGGRFKTNYNLLYQLAARYQSPEVQGVAKWMESSKHVNGEDWWSLVWFDPKVPALPMSEIQPWHYFPDHEVVFWRTDWTENATAFAFKSGPPEGHHTAEKLKKFPDWHLSAGHSHPDANSYIVFVGDKCVTGDSGYAGVPKTEQHNTLLVDGKGQGDEGKGHDPWAKFPYDELNKVRIAEVQLAKGFAHVKGEAAAAYDSHLGLKKFDRHFLLISPTQFVVWDDVESSEPRTFTSFIHSDATVKPAEKSAHVIDMRNVQLTVSPKLPQDAKLAVEKNIVTAPGRPGAVDKGEQQHRGERLAISTGAPVKKATFVVQFEIGGDSASSAAGK